MGIAKFHCQVYLRKVISLPNFHFYKIISSFWNWVFVYLTVCELHFACDHVDIGIFFPVLIEILFAICKGKHVDIEILLPRSFIFGKDDIWGKWVILGEINFGGKQIILGKTNFKGKIIIFFPIIFCTSIIRLLFLFFVQIYFS